MPARHRKRPKLIRLGVAPPLSRREIAELKALAAADVRSIGNLVARLVVESLGRADLGASADPGEARAPYSIPLYLTRAEPKRLEARAQAERRSLSSYVARVIAAELAR